MGAQTKAQLIEELALERARAAEWKQACGDAQSRLEVVNHYREEDRGYRQHAENEAAALRRLLIDIAPFALKELRQLAHDHPSEERYDELISGLEEFEASQ